MLRMLLLMLPFLLVVFTILFALMRSIGQVWVRHRVQMTLLEHLEKRPELMEEFQEIQELTAQAHDPEPSAWKPDYILTGVILAVLGMICAVVCAAVGGSLTATAAYFGGVMCVCLGFILAMVGLLVRYLSHNAVKGLHDD